MIKSLRLRNFKAFEDTGPLELKPITVLAGPNSGGKSSVLQSLLLLKQTTRWSPRQESEHWTEPTCSFPRFNELAYGKPPLSQCDVRYEFEIDSPVPTNIVPDYFPGITPPKGSDSFPIRYGIELGFRYKRRKDWRIGGTSSDFRSSQLLTE